MSGRQTTRQTHQVIRNEERAKPSTTKIEEEMADLKSSVSEIKTFRTQTNSQTRHTATVLKVKSGPPLPMQTWTEFESQESRKPRMMMLADQ